MSLFEDYRNQFEQRVDSIRVEGDLEDLRGELEPMRRTTLRRLPTASRIQRW